MSPLLKVWYFFQRSRAVTIGFIVGTWVLLFLSFVIWRIVQQGTVEQAAASIDKQAQLQDELKTALWFINNPRSSEWINAQIHRAARNRSEEHTHELKSL